jgi:hypothetical protein
MKARASLTFLFMLMLFSGLSGQVLLRGLVKDSVSGETLPFCSYILKGTMRGGITDEFGQFSVYADKLPATIVFSTVGYRRKEIVFRSEEVQKIQLFPVTFELAGVTITAEKVVTWHPEDAWTFMDFKFYDDFILALVSVRGQNKEYLVLLDTLGTTVTSLQLKRGADSLYTDCLGAIHLFSGDSVYQVYYDYEKLSLPYVSPRNKFAAEMIPCRCRLGPYYYFSFLSHHDQSLDYYYINWYEKGRYYPFLSIHDSDKIVALNEDYDMRYFLERRRLYQEYAEPLDSLVKHMDMYRDQLPLTPLEQAWLFPIQSPLTRVQSHVYIVNPLDSTLLTFEDAGRLQHNTTFPCLKLSGWKTGELYGDEITDALYGRIVQKGSSVFVRVDPQTGKEMGRVDVSGYAYITHPMVRGGNVYFLWKDPYSEQPAKLRVVSLK